MIRVGVTGHRDLDKMFIKDYQYKIYKKLLELKQDYSEVVLFSALADGADRLVVHEAIKLNIRLIAVLPMQKELYKDDFDVTSKIEFDKLLTKAHDIVQITHIDIFSKELQYELAGKYISDHCDILIALWDGKYNNLQGGTSEIVSYHLENKKELWHLKVGRNDI